MTMPYELIVAAYGFFSLVAYALFGGADFGGGVWDLFATGPRRQQQREAIARAIGPVWEANHVWLIFIIVLLFSGFPEAFKVLSIALFVPFHLVLVGITLRGAAFVFRGHNLLEPRAQAWSVVFGVASVISPFLLGTCMGAVSSGKIGYDHNSGQVIVQGIAPWLTLDSLTIGALALSICAYLAAVYLTNETDGELQEDFRKRALAAGTLVVVLMVLILPLLYVQDSHLWEGLIQMRSLPVLVGGMAATFLSGWALWRRRFRLARAASIAQVVLLPLGWRLAQYPFLIYPGLTVEQAAAPTSTLRFLAIGTPLGLLVLIPSLVFLYWVFKRAKAG